MAGTATCSCLASRTRISSSTKVSRVSFDGSAMIARSSTANRPSGNTEALRIEVPGPVGQVVDAG